MAKAKEKTSNERFEKYNKPFPTRLRELLETEKLTQTALAEHLGVKRQSVGYWQNGETSPDINILKTIAEDYKISADYLLGIIDCKTPEHEEIHKLTGLSDNALGELINYNNKPDAEIVPEIYFLSKLMEQGEFYGILNEIVWLSITAMHKLIYEYEKEQQGDNTNSLKVLGKPLIELLDENGNLDGLNKLMGGPVILSPSETYSFRLNELKEDFGEIVNKLIEETHKGKSLTELNNEIKELTNGFSKSYIGY